MPEVDAHCREIDRCNQRGGRMLSIVDLLEAGTLDRPTAAYLAAAVWSGASFMVGARPGGAGKTTVMGALLNLVPAGVELAPVDGADAIRRLHRNTTPRCCAICHEVGAGDYYAYLWGDELAGFFALSAAGHMLATNLHADDYAEARTQVCGTNPVPAEAFRRMHLLLFLNVTLAPEGCARTVSTVWESDGHSDHRLIHERGGPARGRLVSRTQHRAARDRIGRLVDSGRRTIRDVREWWINNG
jgi:hypothetical protein